MRMNIYISFELYDWLFLLECLLIKAVGRRKFDWVKDPTLITGLNDELKMQV